VPGTPADRLVLDQGHVDLFSVAVQGTALELALTEDVTGAQVKRAPEGVVLHVKEQALSASIPAGFPGSPKGYLLPLTQDPDLLWPGWNTNGTAGTGYTDVAINVTDVQGPGNVYLYSTSTFGGAAPVLAGGSTQLPGSLREQSPAHTHGQWTFSAPGTYTLTAQAVATNPAGGAKLTSNTAVYTIVVGGSTPPAGGPATAPAAGASQGDKKAPAGTAVTGADCALSVDQQKTAGQKAGTAPPAKLASTGFGATTPLVGGGVLLLAGIAALLLKRRRKASAQPGT
jgi:surface-anchored protein/LPXTG-motif cell wall-anchored protein